MAHLVELIYTEIVKGDGTTADPCRAVPQLFTKTGVLIAENDYHNPAGEKNFLNLLNEAFRPPNDK